MKDNLYLLVSGTVAATIAGAFWHLFGANGFAFISTIALIGVATENRRLRKKLHEFEGKQSDVNSSP